MLNRRSIETLAGRLTVNENRALLDWLKGVHKLQANLLYGTGMRLMEAMRLRVKDMDFERKEILIAMAKAPRIE